LFEVVKGEGKFPGELVNKAVSEIEYALYPPRDTDVDKAGGVAEVSNIPG
jgi:hypothetical protein